MKEGSSGVDIGEDGIYCADADLLRVGAGLVLGLVAGSALLCRSKKVSFNVQWRVALDALWSD